MRKRQRESGAWAHFLPRLGQSGEMREIQGTASTAGGQTAFPAGALDRRCGWGPGRRSAAPADGAGFSPRRRIVSLQAMQFFWDFTAPGNRSATEDMKVVESKTLDSTIASFVYENAY